MNLKYVCLGAFIATNFLVSSPCQAGIVIKDGWFYDADEVATMSAEEHFTAGMRAFEKGRWQDAAKQFNIVAINFSTTPHGQESSYYLGICYFQTEEYDLANDAFNNYLKEKNNPVYFQEVIEYKYEIANRFSHGAKRRFFGTRKLPKWASGESMALDIYDEVVAALPCHDISAHALYAKGCLLWKIKDFRSSIEAYQNLIRRFPKHDLAPESYLIITRIYLDQCKYEFQNPDLLALAEINVRRFRQDFPGEERLVQAESDVLKIKETYARGLFDTGQFYERTSHPQASVIYYKSAIEEFPETSVAELCRKRLSALMRAP